jgi:hypothetical protein
MAVTGRIGDSSRAEPHNCPELFNRVLTTVLHHGMLMIQLYLYLIPTTVGCSPSLSGVNSPFMLIDLVTKVPRILSTNHSTHNTTFFTLTRNEATSIARFSPDRAHVLVISNSVNPIFQNVSFALEKPPFITRNSPLETRR